MEFEATRADDDGNDLSCVLAAAAAVVGGVNASSSSVCPLLIAFRSGVGVLVEGLGEEGGDGEGEEGGDHTTGGVAAIALALAVYHLDGLGACALNALVAAIQGTATDDAVVALHCLLLFAAHGGVCVGWLVVLLAVLCAVHQELLQLGVIVAVVALVLRVRVAHVALQRRT